VSSVARAEPTLSGRPKRSLLSILCRVAAASFFGVVCVLFFKSFLETGKWTSLLWIVSEGLVVILFVVRRTTETVSRSPWDWSIAICGSMCFFLVRPSATAVIPVALGVVLQITGLLIQALGKATLGRSFGVLAANRGVVSTGPYRLVRHPIYLGYLVTHVGFLLTNLSGRNLAVYAIGYTFQVLRIRAEEALLGADDAYQDYCAHVRYRLLPRVF
jgi:protein-S-isoprenylcysteine O-methyltransferase Ste14